MKRFVISLFLTILHTVYLNAFMSHHEGAIQQEWKEENLLPFDELMITWNADRPIFQGKFLFYVCVKTDTWSPWLLYATWGSNGQSSYQCTDKEHSIRVYQDALEVIDGKKATGFQIRIVPENATTLNHIYGIHVYTNGDKLQQLQTPVSCSSPIHLAVPGLSQMCVEHKRYRDLCSPTSTTAVIRYLLNHSFVRPEDFAQNVWDAGFDIFGNWVFNVAAASTYLGNKWSCWVERLFGFEDIYYHLSKGVPVVVSIRGPITGSASTYSQGHLIAVIGYDPADQKVLCMDPAFAKNCDTHVAYDLSDFLQAWARRGNIAYVFAQKE